MSDRTFYATTYVVADGTTRTWPFSFAGVNTGQASGTTPYLQPEDVKVQELYTDADGNKQVTQRTGVLNAPNQITIDGPAVQAGREIRIYRETELRFPLVDYRDLQSVSEHDLDLANRQAVFITQETRDAASANLLYDAQGHYNAGRRRIVNMADGIDPTDAVTKRQHDLSVRLTSGYLKPIPEGDRYGKILTFDLEGNPQATLPYPESASALQLALRDTESAANGMGMIAHSQLIFPTVAAMQRVTGYRAGQQVRTLGYYTAYDGGGNDFLVVAAATAPADGGRYIDVPGAQVQGLFPNGVNTKQYGTKADGSTNPTLQLQKAVDVSLSEAPTTAFGTETRIKLGLNAMSDTLNIAGDRTVKGTGGQNATKLVAKLASWVLGAAPVVAMTGAFSKLMNIGVRVDADLYDPVTNTGVASSCIAVTSPNSFGNVIRDARTNGGAVGFDIAAGLETKLDGCFNTGSRDGMVIRAWDTEAHRTILQDNPRYGVESTRGLESTNLHVVRSGVAGVYLRDSGAPVNMHGTFIDTPTNMGFRLAAQRGAMIFSSYILKIGNDQNPAATGVRLETGSTYNAFIGGNVVNTGTNYSGVFSMDAASINNTIAFWKITSKTAVPASQRLMWNQTVVGCMDEAARYNNIPRKCRAQVSGVEPDKTAQLIFTLDYNYPAVSFNTILFYGKWVSRTTQSQAAIGDVYIPIQSGDSGCSFEMKKINGHAAVLWEVESAILGGTQLIITVRNKATTTASVSMELERSLDATGATF